ncbi:hypothetical protein SAMN05446935_2531 [Burkholderia sp. YR290]|jgi:hypothetical protein|nr:hypothetical protein PMI06_006658 [Burkholderia sp. BT03]SKC64534.1 hypothetical protein SAMN05446934_1332 [Paraburkholderia hospita]SKC93807.1 hypothetical protein SAMN06266956_5766 [Paraburkholderia hospita]SOE64802.1 hypothetical protein SAMN05446935_2531 [Burkholderia sp. YR290]
MRATLVDSVRWLIANHAESSTHFRDTDMTFAVKYRKVFCGRLFLFGESAEGGAACNVDGGSG